ncbi:MAG: hypothetical protein IMZ53_16815 [Thermoplasmata archaeon]|nr:hypothetical protein [Thermoplasmata archaeon]
MLENAAESPASSVSMKVQPDGVAVGHVFGYACVCSVNGNAYPGTLREGPVETCMGSSDLDLEQARSSV